jgi:hypothetical protein
VTAGLAGAPVTGVRRWHMVIAGLATVALLAVCGLFSWQVLQDEFAGNAQAGQPDESGAPTRDIGTREADPEPLTEDEVFPTEEITISAGEDPYQLLDAAESEDCTVAGADGLADLLGDLDCTQVVRGTLHSPDEDFLVTTGVLNLASEDAARQAYDDINELINDQTGRFVGMLAGSGTEPIMISETKSGWDYRGHFLIYAVIAKVDGTGFTTTDDRYAELIIWDMVEVHLRSGVLEARATAEAPAGDRATAGTEEEAPEGDG